MEPNHVRTMLYAMAALLVLAVLKMPYGYYQFMRMAVSVGALIGTFHLYNRRAFPGAVVCPLAAIVFNPVAPLHFDRELWTMINLGFAVVLAATAFFQANIRRGGG